MKIVKTAKIEIVKLEQLKEGDEILWSNLRCGNNKCRQI